MKVHVVQKKISNTEIEPYLIEARREGVDLICFGELATTGCLYQRQPVASFGSLLKKLLPYDFGIMIGFPKESASCLRNAYMYFSRGHYQLYYKINLFSDMNEPDVYRAGIEPGIFGTEYGRIGAAICYDIRFPELFGRLQVLGADMFVIPAAFPVDRIDQWRQMVIQRAKEAGIPAIAINSVGKDDRYTFGGCSMVVSGLGEVLAEADNRSETVLRVQL